MVVAASEQSGEGTPLLGTDSDDSNTKNHSNSNCNNNEFKAVQRKRVSFREDTFVGLDEQKLSWRDSSSRSDSGFLPTSTPHNRERENSSSSFPNILARYTTSEREKALLKEGVGAAAFLIRDAVLGEVENPAQGVYDPYQHPERQLRNAISIMCRRLTAYRPLFNFLRAVAWTLVLLTFVEPPHWCRETSHEHGLASLALSSSSKSSLVGCPAYFAAKGVPADDSTDIPVQYYPNSGSLLVTGTQSNRIEAICLVIITFFLLLRFGRDGLSITRYLRAGTSRVTRIVQLLCLGVLVAGMIIDYKPHHPFSRLFLLATFLPGSQRDMKVLMNMLPEIGNILALLSGLMLFYAWFGAVMFVDTEEGNVAFGSLVEAMWTLVCIYICFV